MEVFAGEEDVKVVDVVGGDDITKRVLAQAILFEEGRRRTTILPVKLLRDLLRHRGEGAGLERKVSRALGEPTSRGKNDVEAGGGEMDELKRRLRALESQLTARTAKR